MEKQKEVFVITRTMFCKTCYEKRKPQKNDIFVVYRGNHGMFAVRKNHIIAIPGFTPHLITWEGYPEVVNGLVTLSKCCAVNHCGIYVDEHEYNTCDINEEVGIKMTGWTDFILPVREFEALVDLWRGNTGYNIF